MTTPPDQPAILLIDDAVEEVVLVTTLIEKAGPYRVKSTHDGHEGLELLRRGGWALALVDLNLPGVDGIDLIHEARAADPDLPIVAVTGSTSSLMIDGAFRAGADYVLNKPIDRDELIRKVKEFAPIEGGTTAAASGAADAVGAPAPSAEVGKHVPTVVAVGGRPGDVEMGIGGILFKHRSEGHRVILLNLAGGGDLHSDLAVAAGRASAMLGAELRCVGDENEDAVDPEGAKELLQTVISETAPGMLYLPTNAAKRQSSLESHRVALALAGGVPNILAYECPMATVEFRPQFFVDVGPFLLRKKELLLPYSELGMTNVSVELASATARYWGRFMEPEMVEPLEVLRRGGA